MSKATFTTGVFGLAARRTYQENTHRSWNVRTDQERQKKIAGLPADSKVKIVDIPGGGVDFDDFPEPKKADLFAVLRRDFRRNWRLHDRTAWRIAKLRSWLLPTTPMKRNHRAIWPSGRQSIFSADQNRRMRPWNIHGSPAGIFENENEYRCVSGLGKTGRTGRMICAAFDFYEANESREEFFSHPEFEWLRIDLPSGPVEHILLSGNPDCLATPTPSLALSINTGDNAVSAKNAVAWKLILLRRTQLEFYGMSGEYIVEEDGSPGPGL